MSEKGKDCMLIYQEDIVGTETVLLLWPEYKTKCFSKKAHFDICFPQYNPSSIK